VLGLLARPEDNFRESLAQRAMVIDAGKPKILERQMFEAPAALMRRDGTAPDFFQEFQYVLAIHAVELCLMNDE
jgi:hypothetical protein